MKLWPVNNGLFIVFEVECDFDVVGHQRRQVYFGYFDDVCNEGPTCPQHEGSLSGHNGQSPVGKLQQNILTFYFPLLLGNGLYIFDPDLDLEGGGEEPFNFLEDQVVVEFVHFGSVAGQKVLLGGRSVNQSLNVVVQRWLLKVVGHSYGLSPVQLNVPE